VQGRGEDGDRDTVVNEMHRDGEANDPVPDDHYAGPA
jgi:hypothetical protein